eukprot:m.181486 g.181486  ORF g.181486 m.181486 type:complete len:420 (+) comp32068_c0_seq3:169-1428(+)
MISSPTLLFCTTLFIVPTHTSAAFNYGVGGVKFKNCASRTMTMYWKSFSGEPDYAGRVAPDCGTNGFQTYEGHEFFWSEYQQDPPVPTTYPGAKFVEFAIQEDQRLYYYIDDSTKPEVLAKLQEEIDFMEEYKNRTGRHWVGTTWPRPPPTFEFIQPEYVGQKIQVALPEVAAKWECTSDHIPDCYTDGGKILNENASQVETPFLTLEVIALEPKAFKVEEFLTDFEADYIIDQARPMLGMSSVGHGGDARVAKQRTSKSAWLHRGHSAVLNSIYARMGVVTNVPIDAMDPRNVESINVLHYGQGAEYTPHFDWGADGNVNSRFITSLLYLNTPTRGGETTFPRVINEDGSLGTSIKAQKRQGAFFYDLLEDGNADEMSLHSGAPVLEGEKWIAPLWIWEPIRWKSSTDDQASNVHEEL